MAAQVQLERDGDILVVSVDNPPINAASAEVRGGLLAAIETLRGDDGLSGAVLKDGVALERGAGRIHDHYASRLRGGKLKTSVAAACDWPRAAQSARSSRSCPS